MGSNLNGNIAYTMTKSLLRFESFITFELVQILPTFSTKNGKGALTLNSIDNKAVLTYE